jgi:hypothetical protein
MLELGVWVVLFIVGLAVALISLAKIIDLVNRRW